MKTTDFARVVESAPANVTAARVVSRGVQYDPQKKITQEHWDAPPRCIRVPYGREDLTGLKQGRLTVIGLYDIGHKNGARWAVRCLCGKYETRRSKALKNPNNTGDRCAICRHQWHIRRDTRRLAGGDVNYTMNDKD